LGDLKKFTHLLLVLETPETSISFTVNVGMCIGPSHYRFSVRQ